MSEPTAPVVSASGPPPGPASGRAGEPAATSAAPPVEAVDPVEAVEPVDPVEPSGATPAPAPPSRYARWRRRGAPLVLFIALAVLAHETCQSQERRAVILELELGPSAARVRQLWVDVFVDGEPVAHYQRTGNVPPRLEATLSGETAEVRIDLELAPLAPGGQVTRRVVTRRVRGEGGSTVTLPLADELAK